MGTQLVKVQMLAGLVIDNLSLNNQILTRRNSFMLNEHLYEQLDLSRLTISFVPFRMNCIHRGHKYYNLFFSRSALMFLTGQEEREQPTHLWCNKQSLTLLPQYVHHFLSLCNQSMYSHICTNICCIISTKLFYRHFTAQSCEKSSKLSCVCYLHEVFSQV